MLPVEFAAQRRERLTRADDELHGVVDAGLVKYANGDAAWKEEILDAAAQLWIEHFEAEAPGRSFERPLARFRTSLSDSLDKTREPDGAVTDGQVDRVTRWLSSYTVNDGTVTGAFGRGITHKRWVTMHDASVREIHEDLDGQTVPIGGAFNVAGTKLGYPGEPVGPPEVWINCRCLAQPAARTGEVMSLRTHTMGPEDELEDNHDIIPSGNAFAIADPFPGEEEGDGIHMPEDEDLVPDEPEEDEDLITEIPIHGVAAPEGVATGDGRMFAIGALSSRDLPLPLLYQPMSVEGHERAYTVGRLDEIWRDEANLMRYKGAIVLGKELAGEVVDGIIDATIRGVSVDVDDVEMDLSREQELMERMEAGDEDAKAEYLGMDGKMPMQIFAKARIAGLTIVSIPAFQEAYIALGDEFEEDLSDDDKQEQAVALAACGCMEAGIDIEDVSGDPVRNARAAIEAAAFRKVSTEERDKRAEDGTAMPDGSYPIANVDDLRNAIQAIGRAKDPAAAKAHIKKRARALGHPELIPEDWALKPWPGDLTEAEQEKLLKEIPDLMTTGLRAAGFAPGTKDGPGWITHPVPTARIRRYWTKGEGAAKIGWGTPGDFNRCRMQLAKYVKNPDWLAGLCANMHKEALGFWPAQHHSTAVVAASAARAPMVILASAATQEYPSEWFANPKLDRARPLRIDKDTGRIYGYLAEWGTCHLGVDGLCTTPPRAVDDYAHFLKGVVDTDAGEQRVGTLTYGIGHANVRMRAAAATAHYDKVDAIRAYVNVGEDEFGIWFAGVLAPWVSEADIQTLRAIGSLSGDWRDPDHRGNLDLIGAVWVNTPAFALAASAGKQSALIGAGRLSPEPAVVASASLGLDPELIGAIARTAVAELRHQEKIEAKIAPVRAKLRERRLAAARERMKG